MKGFLITFEGSEGSGKSTHSKLLCEYLAQKGREYVFVREPGSTQISEQIRGILLSVKNKGMSAKCELMLYMAARAQIVDEVIKPALDRGEIVVCDRFLDSTRAYQGYGLGMSLKDINAIGDFVTSGIKPDITFFLDFSVDAGLKRLEKEKDRIESRPLEFHEKVRLGYLEMAGKEPWRIKIIKIGEDKAEAQAHIRNYIDKLIE